MYSKFFNSATTAKTKEKTKEKTTDKSNQFESLPEGHTDQKLEDVDKCPAFQFEQNAKKENKKDGKKGTKKPKKMQGGCPYMTSDKKKNPALAHMEESWQIEYISKFSYLLDYRGFLTFRDENDEEIAMEKRRIVFDKYPIYLKHTLFHNDENTQKIRELEISQRYFIYDQLREKGNKCYTKEKYAEALEYYERALGCYKWLEYKEEEDKEEEEKEETKQEEPEEMEIDFKNLKNLKTLENTKDTEKVNEIILKKMKKQDKEYRKKFKYLMSTYEDRNVFLHDGEEDLTKADQEMRVSMLMQIYLNLAVAHMQLKHYRVAEQALADAYQITNKSSQVYFRRAQNISYNKWSTLEQLEDAKNQIETAIEMKRHEKMFNAQPGIIKMMNIENHNEIYISVAEYVVKRIEQKKQEEKEKIIKVLARVKQIEQIEQRLISEGKTPIDDSEAIINMKEEEMEMEVVAEMEKKYYKIIEFYQEQKQLEQVAIAKRELQGINQTLHDMFFFVKMEFKNSPVYQELLKEFELDDTKKNTLYRIERVSRQESQKIFENGQYNFEVYEYALKDYFKKRDEKKEQSQNKPKQYNVQKKNFGLSMVTSIGQFAIGGLMCFLAYQFTQDFSMLKNGIDFAKI